MFQGYSEQCDKWLRTGNHELLWMQIDVLPANQC